jgi:uncharacterized protein YjiS (DUF1127 family)
MARIRLDFPVELGTFQSQPARRRSLLRRVWDRLRQWRQTARDRRRLAMLSDRSLRDIGLSRVMVEYELSRPSWRELRDWRR